MRKEIRTIDEKAGVVRITTTDERWYAKFVSDPVDGLPTFLYLPSVTWILSIYPKLGLMRLRDEVGADEAELMKKLGGERGSKVHAACSAIIEGKEVRHDSVFDNGHGIEEELTADELRYVMSFVEWKNKVNPEFLAWDRTVLSEKHGFGGTLDFIARVDGEIFLVDIKTSKVITTEYAMQVSAYKQAIVNLENDLGIEEYLGDMKLAILQLGTKPLKTIPEEYRWKEVDDNFDLFLATRKIWQEVYETQIRDGKGWTQKDFPLVLSPETKVEVVQDEQGTLLEANGVPMVTLEVEEPVVKVSTKKPK